MQNFAHAAANNNSQMNGEGAHAFSLENNTWKLLVITALAYIIWSDKLSINLIYGDSPAASIVEEREEGQKVKAGFVSEIVPSKKSRKPETKVVLPAGPINNVTFAIDPGFAERYGVSRAEMEARNEQCLDYLKHFAPIAVAEMRKYGIPASITLAQGLLESNAGVSKLARNANNHFGIKCFSRTCGKGHCLNFTDDSHKDFFVKYPNIWGSYRAHSQFLKNSGRYDALFKLDRNDYRAWAKGLAKAGYATDKRYGEKLIAIVQSLGLDRYDQ